MINCYLPRPPERLPPLLRAPPPMPPDERGAGEIEPPDLPELGRTPEGREAGRGAGLAAGRAGLAAGRAEPEGLAAGLAAGRVGRLVAAGLVACPAGRLVPTDGRTARPGCCRVVLRTPSRLRTPLADGLTDSRVRVPRLTWPADARRPPVAARVIMRPLAPRASVPFALRTVERAVRVLIRSRDAERGALVRLSIMTRPG